MDTKLETFKATSGEREAMRRIAKSSYPFPAQTKIAVYRRMLREIWQKVFPNEKFPQDEEVQTDPHPV